jgi:hypothetical protein
VKLHGEIMRRLVRIALGVGLFCGMTFGLSGCRHRMQLPTLPPIQEPVALVEIPPPADPPMLETQPVDTLPTPIAAAAAKLKRERKKVVAKAAPAPQIAPPAPPPVAGPAPEVNAVGALTAGEEANPQTKQDAADLVASLEKRLNSLPAQTTEEQKAQISKARNFWRDAQAALKSGDSEGAMTLATKAKLLLDDLEK